jgi:hypothetical protein
MNHHNRTGGQTSVSDKHARWKEMPPARRVGAILVTLLQISLLVVALRDLRQRPPEQIRGGKRLWSFLVFINWIGPISYFLFGRQGREDVTIP